MNNRLTSADQVVESASPVASEVSCGSISTCAGAAEVRRQMTVTLTPDHRVVYGTDAAEFLTSVRTALEAPEGLAQKG